MTNKILDHQQIQHKINRIAYQIYESNANEKEIIIAGIEGGGQLFAKKLSRVLEKITPAKISMCTVLMNKKNILNSFT